MNIYKQMNIIIKFCEKINNYLINLNQLITKYKKKYDYN